MNFTTTDFRFLSELFLNGIIRNPILKVAVFILYVYYVLPRLAKVYTDFNDAFYVYNERTIAVKFSNTITKLKFKKINNNLNYTRYLLLFLELLG